MSFLWFLHHWFQWLQSIPGPHFVNRFVDDSLFYSNRLNMPMENRNSQSILDWISPSPVQQRLVAGSKTIWRTNFLFIRTHIAITLNLIVDIKWEKRFITTIVHICLWTDMRVCLCVFLSAFAMFSAKKVKIEFPLVRTFNPVPLLWMRYGIKTFLTV